MSRLGQGLIEALEHIRTVSAELDKKQYPPARPRESLNRRRCPNCEYLSPQEAKFCAECGSPLRKTEDTSGKGHPAFKSTREFNAALQHPLFSSKGGP